MDAYLVEMILGEHGAVDWRHGAWVMNYWGVGGGMEAFALFAGPPGFPSPFLCIKSRGWLT